VTKAEKRYKIKTIVKLFHCTPEKALDILNFNENKIYSEHTVMMTRDCNNYHLVPSLGLKDTYYLFTDIAEKKLKAEGFKVLNSEDFSETELAWLDKNYKFKCKNKYK
jgi:hypothetical protein